MPSLVESLGKDMSGYTPITAAPPSAPSMITTTSEPTLNTYLRCPIPPVWSSSPDALRQFYQGSRVPQTRLFNPNTT